MPERHALRPRHGRDLELRALTVPADQCRAHGQTCDVTSDCCVEDPELVCTSGIRLQRLD
jgi:hypothetical protein